MAKRMRFEEDNSKVQATPGTTYFTGIKFYLFKTNNKRGRISLKVGYQWLLEKRCSKGTVLDLKQITVVFGNPNGSRRAKLYFLRVSDKGGDGL